MTASIPHLLRDIFNCDFASLKTPESFRKHFFNKKLALSDLHKISALACAASTELGGKNIPASLLIKGKNPGKPLAILAQLHGNEPAGLAGIALALALAEAKLLEHHIIAVIGNPLAAAQYFEAWQQNPKARQETRDAYRCGLAPDGKLLPDMNRIPADFMTRDASDPHIRRAQELYAMVQQTCGILDIHSARGSMLCITDHKHDRDLKHSSIRAVLLDLADAISANVSIAGNTMLTFKTIASPLPNIVHQVGIEAGKHEAVDTPKNAAEYTLSLLYNLGLTKVPPLAGQEDDGSFEGYRVKPRITYADLTGKEKIQANDKIYMAMECTSPEQLPRDASRVVIRKDNGHYALQPALEHIVNPLGTLCYALHQYEEMEAIAKDQVVAIALPSGAVLKAPKDFSGIFWSKSALLYDKDPAVGPWPVEAAQMATTKFCYPCDVGEMILSF